MEIIHIDKYNCGNVHEGGGTMRRLFSSPWRGIFFAAVGLIMMGLGIYRGEMEVVLEKAIHICMECIGIG